MNLSENMICINFPHLSCVYTIKRFVNTYLKNQNYYTYWFPWAWQSCKCIIRKTNEVNLA